MKEYVSNTVENTVANGEIAHHEQFLLLSQRLQTLSVAGASGSVCQKEKLLIMSHSFFAAMFSQSSAA